MSASDEIAEALAQAVQKIEQITEALAPLKNEEAGLLAKQRALQEAHEKAMAEITAKRQEIANKNYQLQHEISLKQQEAKQKEYELAQLKAAEEAEARRKEREAANAVLTERFDLLTMRAKWREWAKDHQIQGAHRLTEYKKVILADPMGLGKTLTVISALDMIERATKDATPEFPFLGEEKEVYVNGGWKRDPETQKDEWVDGHYETQIVNGVTRPVGRRVLYLCPAALLRNVLSEFRQWAPHRNVTYVGGMTKAEREFALSSLDLLGISNFVIICNYEAWRKDLGLIKNFIDLDFDTVIMDEAHIIKDPKSIAYRGVKQIIDETQPEYIIPMTGTPILNKPQDLFSLLHLVNREEFFRERDFLFQFCEQDEDGKWRFQPGGLDRVAKKIRNNFLRRTKDDVGLDLPSKTIINHDLEVDEEAYPNQAKVRQQMRDYATIMVNEEEGKAVSAAAIIAMYTRLRQVETWPAGIRQTQKEYNDQGMETGRTITIEVDVEESQKVDYVIKYDPDSKEWSGLIPEVIEDERVVLFSQFKAPLRELQRRCAAMGLNAVIMDGETPDAFKEEIHRDFNAQFTPNREDAKYDVVLCNYRVGGVGLNLTAATQLIVLDEEWNPGKRDQAYDRIHRIGQTKPVTIHVVRTQKTIDDWLAGIMDQKDQMVEGFNNSVANLKDFKEALESGLI